MADTGRGWVLRFVGAQLVFIAAVIHLAIGLLEWVPRIRFGIPFSDLRWPAFIVSALVLLGGLYAARTATDKRPYYVGGILAMAGYVVGYFGWHLGGHRPLLVFGPGAGSEAVSVRWFLDHLFAGPVEFAAIAVETLAIAVLAALLVLER